MIDGKQIKTITSWLDNDLEKGGGDAIADWFAAHSIDEPSVIEQAVRYSRATLLAIEEGEDVAAVILAPFLIGFQVGVEAELRRRDRQELPT